MRNSLICFEKPLILRLSETAALFDSAGVEIAGTAYGNPYTYTGLLYLPRPHVLPHLGRFIVRLLVKSTPFTEPTKNC